ncbi:hypothetical protein [Nonomuraea pusilla]|uniref:WD40-like Beta Propeller Repeat n=1 Tax=Nonomuraea pusilla TaxID=46177 RepID=A0A1H7XIC0_9ACTN|nr:hypothetical protein [Nonomuraea pusilla]SEM33354.1 hypothetical protein SAMN05660976_04823 [Nonomuraea pusilla]
MTTRLRRALDGIADEAPPVDLSDLADRIVTRRPRPRRWLPALAAAGVALVVGAAAGTVTLVLPPAPGARPAASATGPLPDLPAGAVGPLRYAYLTQCTVEKNPEQTLDCSAVEWQVVTQDGKRYRVPQALALAGNRRIPLAISRDGRRLAYYSRQAGAHVVRDLATGAETVSPVKIEERRIGIGSMLAVSDDGRHLVFDPREGTKDPGTLIDVRTGRTVPVPGRYEVVTVKDGVAELVRYVRTDLRLMPVTGRPGRTVRFGGAFIFFSELAPDGRTVAAVEHAELAKRRITLLDTRTGRKLREVAVTGLPREGAIGGTGLWRSGTELTLLVEDRDGMSGYAVDVTTGRARRVTAYPGATAGLTALPGLASG